MKERPRVKPPFFFWKVPTILYCFSFFLALPCTSRLILLYHVSTWTKAFRHQRSLAFNYELGTYDYDGKIM